MAGLPRKSRAAIRPIPAPFSPAMSRERPGAGARRRVDSGQAHNKMVESFSPRRRHISFRHSACVGRIVTSHLLPAFARANLAFERGDGAWLIATDGERYLDFASGVAVNALGHAHPHLVKALGEQAQKLWHVSNLFRIPEGERLAPPLGPATIPHPAVFANSGADAPHSAVHTARQYHPVADPP